MNKVWEVVILNRGNSINTRFHYNFSDSAKIGCRVKVPFGKGTSVAEALVVGTAAQEEGVLYKDILSVIDQEPVVDKVSMEVAEHISREYLCSFQDAISLFFPKGERGGSQGEKVAVSLVGSDEWQKYMESLPKNARAKREVAGLISRRGKVVIEELKALSPSALKICRELAEKSMIEVVVENKRPEDRSEPVERTLVFSDEQEEAVSRILEAHETRDHRAFLLHGITGSGKTEVYIELIRRVLEQGRQSIVLVPEISLTPQTISRFESVFGSSVAFMHSALSEKEKKNQWEKMKDGSCPIAIGPRSALFVPYSALGMIIVDECHSDSYKSEQTPKYDAVELSLFLGEKRGATVVLGSATPNVTQLYRCETGEMELVEMKRRSNRAGLPKITLVDMREEIKNGNNSMISSYLYRRIKENLRKGDQTILFLNKRGFSKNLTCISCGYVHKCPNCDVTLSYHKEEGSFKCHYCNYTSPYSPCCPVCGSNLKDVSFGTQKIAEQVGDLFPEAKVLRMDRDSIKDKRDYEKYLLSFARGEKNVLIGTQMIGKGLDFPGVTLVGVLQADQSMDIPDFRGSEKTFQMLEQVSGRAGRGDKAGEAVIQSFHIERTVFSHLLHRRFREFYEEELSIRRAFMYPPFGQIIRILITSESLEEAGETAKRIEQALEVYFKKAELKAKILGAVPCLINRLESKYRWQIIVKIGEEGEEAKVISILKYIQEKKRNILYAKGSIVVFEKNPNNMM